jgi:hypothetical protein
MDEPRATLKKADSLLASGYAREAIAAYASVAQHYATQGFALKAVALWKQIRVIAERERDPSLGADARTQLITLYRSLGLVSDAEALEKE